MLRTPGDDAEAMRFRIELSSDDFRTIAYTFDQLADPSGWVYASMETGTPGALYVPRRAIAAGSYVWRASTWDGARWGDPSGPWRFRIDDVPPADVRGLAMRRVPSSACVRLEWEPVGVDARGETERIALYHVVRFTRTDAARPPGPVPVGEATATAYDDCDPTVAEQPLVYYRIVAEDEAGNVTGVPPSSPKR